MISLADLIGQWPTTHLDQQTFITNLVTLLNNRLLDIESGESKVIIVSQAFEPSQAQWEAQWLVQANRPLPIPPSAVLFWWNTAQNRLGGVFGTAAGETTVARREHEAPIGSTLFMYQDSRNDSFSISSGLAVNAAKMPSRTFTSRQKFDLILEFLCSVNGTVEYGVDFQVNGVKIGTTEFAVPPDFGLINTNVAGVLYCKHIMRDLAPGTYKVEVLLGLVGTATGTISGGGTTYGHRSLFTRGIVAE